MSDGETDILLQDCTRCGLCREVCIVEKMGSHSITSFLCGEEEYSSWLCSSCWRCQEVCLQGVDIHSVMMEKRRDEEPPPGHQANLVNVLRSGYALPMDSKVNSSRMFHGLEAVQLIPAEWVEILLQGREDGRAGE